jgi:hypothetical protein
MNGVNVNECPRILDPKIDGDSHTISFPQENLKIPLSLKGIVSYFPTRRPTREELESCPRIELTAPEPEWNPHNCAYSQGEDNMTGDDGNVLRQDKPDIQTREIMGLWTNKNMARADDPFLGRIESNVKIGSVQSTTRSNKTTPEQLASRWNIGLDKAKRTLNVTTQRGTRTVAFLSLEARFRTNDRQLRYRRLRTSLYTDLMFASVPSKRGNACAQIYVNDLEWCRAYPLRTKGDAHTSLDLLFPEEEVPTTMISDDAPALHAGEFRRKCRQAGAYCKETEPYSPWMNRAEGTIRELK